MDQQLAKVAKALYLSQSSQCSRDLLTLLNEKNLMDLVQYQINPLDYKDAYAYKRDAYCAAFLKKAPLLIPGIDRKKNAKDKFFEGEHSCKLTNLRFSRFLNNGPFESLSEFRCVEILDTARAFIREVLGPVPRDVAPRFGPGSTLDDRRQLSTIADKMTSQPTITEDALPLLSLWEHTAWCRALCERGFGAHKIVRSDEFVCVPKNAKTDRGISIGASVNVFYQLGVGHHIRARLKRYASIDLQNAQAKHRSLARRASRDGKLATLDLANASGTISKKLVEYLLPQQWFELLDMLRSRNTIVDSKVVHLEMFSAMGNGYTFELETLIFLSLCYAVGCGNSGGSFWCYGDDIIVPTEKASDVTSILSFCGFTLNKEKSFVTGKFRESCGGDYFDGVDVRPYSVTTLPTEPQHWISIANGINRLVRKDLYDDVVDSPLGTAWKRCLDALPANIRRLRGPLELGDLVVNSANFDRRFRSSGIGYIRVYRPISRKIPWKYWHPGVVLACALYGAEDGRTKSLEGWFDAGGVTPRASVIGYKLGYVAYS